MLDLLDHHAVTLLALECCGVILVGQPALRTSFDEKRVGDGGRPSRARAKVASSKRPRKPAQHREHQPPVRCCRVGPSIREGPEPRTGLGGRVQDVEEVPRRAGQPIQPRDQQHIPSTQRRDSAAYCNARALRSVTAHETFSAKTCAAPAAVSAAHCASSVWPSVLTLAYPMIIAALHFAPEFRSEISLSDQHASARAPVLSFARRPKKAFCGPTLNDRPCLRDQLGSMESKIFVRCCSNLRKGHVLRL